MIPTSTLHRFLPSNDARSRAASAVNCHDEPAQRSNLKRAARGSGRVRNVPSLGVYVIARVSLGLAD
jgi:hypothetical protein